MATLKLLVTLEYDAEIMHGGDADVIDWFFKEVLKDDLILHSNILGDEIGVVRIISIEGWGKDEDNHFERG